MKSTKKSFNFTALLFCFLLASCNSIGASTPLPTVASMSTAVPVVILPTVIPTAVPSVVLSTVVPTAVPVVVLPTVAPVPTETAVVPPTVEVSFAEQVVNAFLKKIGRMRHQQITEAF